MIRRRHLWSPLSSLLAVALGCASLPPAPDTCPRSIDEVLGSPALLRQQADFALAKDDPELAYRYLALLQTLHPDSPDSRELFPAAAKLFKRAYFPNRISKPYSVWVNSEPAFMFQWLAHFFEGEDFPQEQVDLLFVGMPLDFYEAFAAQAKQRQRLFAWWEIEAVADDGRVESVTATRTEVNTERARLRER